MGSVIGSVSAQSSTTSYTIVDVPSPGVVGPCVVNNYTTLSVTSYVRALDFKSANMASFPRSVHDKDGIEVDHKIDKILSRQPNSYQSGTMLWRTWHFHAAHYANGFVEIERDALFNVKAFHNRPPEIVAPFRYLDDDGNITGWYWVGGYRPHIVAAADMMHLTGLSYDGLSGLNPVWIHAETFERARLMDRYITRFLVKGSVIKGSIECAPGMTEEQQQAMVETLRKFRGADADDDLLVLAGAKLSNAGVNNEQSQLIQLHELSDVQIAQLTGVHPHFLYADKNGKYNNSPEQAGEDIVRYTFRLLIEQAEDEMLKLLSPSEQDAGLTVHIDPGALLRGDIETQSAIAEDLKTAGLITTNEARLDIGYPELKDPAADKLATLGESNPVQQPLKPDDSPKAAAAAPSPSLQHFSALIAAAAQRVQNKNNKGTENSQKKNKGDDFIRWGNVFSQELEADAIEAMQPIMLTIAAINNQPVDMEAVQKIGNTYGTALRGHYSKLNRQEASEAPDLQAIVTETMKGNHNAE